MNANPTLLATQIQVKFSSIILTTFLRPRNFSSLFFKSKLKVMRGERANKITLSPPQLAIRTDVQARKEATLLRLLA